MAIPKKGSRKICVDGEPYLWLVRRKVTYGQEVYGNGTLHVAIEHSIASGGVLVIVTDKPHPKDIHTKVVIPATPSDIECWIRQAIILGWQPLKKGKQFTVDLNKK